jgi:hypothetical protein
MESAQMTDQLWRVNLHRYVNCTIVAALCDVIHHAAPLHVQPQSSNTLQLDGDLHGNWAPSSKARNYASLTMFRQSTKRSFRSSRSVGVGGDAAAATEQQQQHAFTNDIAGAETAAPTYSDLLSNC